MEKKVERKLRKIGVLRSKRNMHEIIMENGRKEIFTMNNETTGQTKKKFKWQQFEQKIEQKQTGKNKILLPDNVRMAK